MKNTLSKIFIAFILLSFTFTSSAYIKSYNIYVKQKVLLEKDFVNSYKKLKRFPKGKEYIGKINTLLYKNQNKTKKLVEIYNKIWKIKDDLNNSNKEGKEQLIATLNYLQYRIGYILYSDKDVAKIKFGIYFK